MENKNSIARTSKPKWNFSIKKGIKQGDTQTTTHFFFTCRLCCSALLLYNSVLRTMTNFNPRSPLVNLQANSVLVVMLLCILFASFLQTPVLSCGLPKSGDDILEPPLAVGFIDDEHFIALFNVSGGICFFQAPGTAVANGKVTLPPGKDIKEVWPDVALDQLVNYAAILSDKKDGHYMLFRYVHHDKDDDNDNRDDKEQLPSDIVVDLVAKKALHDGKPQNIPYRPFSTRDPMTLYSFSLMSGTGYLTRFVYPGNNLLHHHHYKTKALYQFCRPKNGTKGNHREMVATQLSADPYDDLEKCSHHRRLKVPDLLKSSSGFTDDTNFYVVGHGVVLTFSLDAVSREKLGKTVPFTVTNFTDFFVQGGGDGGDDDNGDNDSGKNEKKGKNKTLMWILIGVAVVAVVGLMVAVFVYFCFCSSNKADHAHAHRRSSSSGSGGGRGGGRRRGSSRGGGGSKSKKRKSASKTRRKSSKRGGGGSSIKPSHSRHSKPSKKRSSRKRSSTTAAKSRRPTSRRATSKARSSKGATSRV